MADMNNGKKIHGIQTRLAELRIDLEGALVRRSIKPRDLSSRSCVDFATQYNVLYDKWQTGHLLCVLRLEIAQPPLFSPTTKWRKRSPNSVRVHL